MLLDVLAVAHMTVGGDAVAALVDTTQLRARAHDPFKDLDTAQARLTCHEPEDMERISHGKTLHR